MEPVLIILLVGTIIFLAAEIWSYRVFVKAVEQFNVSAGEVRSAFVAASTDILNFNTRLNIVENQANAITQDIITMDIVVDLLTKAAGINPESLAKLKEITKITVEE